jgi:hypothetical protein
MNEGTLSTAFSPNFATKLCFFGLEGIYHMVLRPSRTFLPLFWTTGGGSQAQLSP